MEAVTIHIATNKRFVKVYALLARLLGGVYSVETVKKRTLTAVIDQAEKDFAEGNEQSFTIDELRNLTNEVA